MDPDACFSALLEQISHQEWDDAGDSAESLQQWMRNGGFPPGGGKLHKTSVYALLRWVIDHPKRDPDLR